MSNKRFNIGLLVANVMDPYSNRVAKGAMQAAENLDFENAKQILCRIIEERDIRKAELKITNAELKEAARQNASYAISLLDN